MAKHFIKQFGTAKQNALPFKWCSEFDGLNTVSQALHELQVPHQQLFVAECEPTVAAFNLANFGSTCQCLLKDREFSEFVCYPLVLQPRL